MLPGCRAPAGGLRQRTLLVVVPRVSVGQCPAPMWSRCCLRPPRCRPQPRRRLWSTCSPAAEIWCFLLRCAAPDVLSTVTDSCIHGTAVTFVQCRSELRTLSAAALPRQCRFSENMTVQSTVLSLDVQHLPIVPAAASVQKRRPCSTHCLSCYWQPCRCALPPAARRWCCIEVQVMVPEWLHMLHACGLDPSSVTCCRASRCFRGRSPAARGRTSSRPMEL